MKTLYQKQLSKTIRTILAIIGGYSLLLLMDYSSNHQHNSTICLFKIITSIPCPGCGMGRATLALFRGDIIGSFSYNILCIPLTIGVIISLCWLVSDLIRNRETFFATTNRKIHPIYLASFFIVTAISWVVNIIRGV